MIDMRDAGELLGAALAALCGGLWGHSALKRRTSRDRVEVRRDVAEVDIIARLERQLAEAETRADRSDTRADVAFRERNEAMVELGQWRERVVNLTAQVTDLRNQVAGLQTQITVLMGRAS